MVHLPTIIGIWLSCHISITKSCLRSNSQEIPDNLGCVGASERINIRILTGNAIMLKYFHRINHKKIKFYVKASTHAEIIFHTLRKHAAPRIKIIIGQNENSQSVFEEHWPNHDYYIFPVATPNILDAKQYRGFWISFHDDKVHVGKENEEEPFMTYTSPLDNYSRLLFDSTSISLSTPLVEIGEWIIVQGIKHVYSTGWCDRSKTKNPRSNAVKVDVSNGKHVYICRSIIEGDVVPGYAKSPNGGCKFHRSHTSHKSMSYQLLLGGIAVTWLPAQNNVNPTIAVVGGWADKRKPLFICRFEWIDKRIIIGNTDNNGFCSAASKGKTYSSVFYDILI